MGTNAGELSALKDERRAAIPTREAAPHLGRSPQTLRLWAMNDSGPIRPLKVHGRLLWPVSEIRRLLGLAE